MSNNRNKFNLVMKPQTKAILKNSLVEFKQAKSEKQAEMVVLVKERLKQHENALKTIGTGYADHFVEAGKIFLRIINGRYKHSAYYRT